MSEMDGSAMPSVVYVIRHGAAMSRSSWTAPDGLRPLSERGHRQAAAIAGRLGAPGSPPLGRVLSSPALRCRATVGPTAAMVGREVEDDDALGEGRDPLGAIDRVLAVLSGLPAGAALAACTHGDVVHGILEHLVGAGIELRGPREAQKGSTWELRVTGGSVAGARYVAPDT